MRVYKSVADLVGATPMIELCGYEKRHALSARIFAKLEYFNPTGSVKDRAAKAMIEDAERKGALKRGATIIEPTSGNTGIGLAAVAAAKAYKVIITMPDTMSVERQRLIKAYGAEIVLTDGKKGMGGAIEKAEQLKSEISGSIIAGQFTNPSNPEAHEKTTGPEIWNDLGGKVDIFVAGVGTGGTLTGAGRYLKSKNKNIKIVAVEPSSSPVLSMGRAGAHGIQGIGAGFVPDVLDLNLIDEVIAVLEKDAYTACRELGTQEGILVGISSGAALTAAKQLALLDENRGKVIAVIFPDGGGRYLSTGIYD